MCKKSKNGANLQMSRKYAVEKRHGGHRTGGTDFARSPALACNTTSAWANRGHARWPVVRGDRTGDTGNARWPMVRF